MKKLLVTSFLLLAALRLAPAASIYGTAAPLAGSTALNGFGNWTGNINTIWDIVMLSANDFLYKYTVTELGSDVSHAVVEFTAGADTDPNAIFVSDHSYDGPKTWNATSPPNFELPTAIFGVKFDGFSGGSPYTFSFHSDRAPVYGDFYVRDGGNAYAYNYGLVDRNSTSLSAFIARPDGGGGGTGNEAPEPTSLILGGVGLVVLAVRKQWQR